MKNRTLVDEFRDLVDGYKIDKVTQLINGDSQSKNLDTEKGIKGFLKKFNTNESEKFEVAYSNALESVDLTNIKSLLSETYAFDFSNDFQDWIEYQNTKAKA